VGDYSLERGRDLGVCAAVLKRLETMAGVRWQCEHEEPASTAGFALLERKRLSVDEIYEVSEQLIGFAEHGAAGYYDARRRDTDSWCAKPNNALVCERILQAKRDAAKNGGRWLETYSKEFFNASVAWRYKPEVDIDNDGAVDPVLMLTRDRCGGENYKGVLERSPTYAFIMEPNYKLIDEDKTRRVFGHPQQQWPKIVESERFRYIGSNLGIFEFGGKTYFYTFMNSFSDLNGERVMDESLFKTLGVFISEDGKTRSICEFRLHTATD
jgi:hypothetical protein